MSDYLQVDRSTNIPIDLYFDRMKQLQQAYMQRLIDTDTFNKTQRELKDKLNYPTILVSRNQSLNLSIKP